MILTKERDVALALLLGLRRGPELLEHLHHRLRLGRLVRPVLREVRHDRHLPRPSHERSRDGQAALLLVHAQVVRLLARPALLAAANDERRARGAAARAPRALLLVRLAPATADLRAGLGDRGAEAHVRLLGHDLPLHHVGPGPRHPQRHILLALGVAVEVLHRNGRMLDPVVLVHLPLFFVSANIVGLYLIYTLLHLLPMMQLDVAVALQNKGKKNRAIVECVIFQCVTLLLVICYIKSILTHPGEIPDKDEDASWEYVPKDIQSGAAPPLQESKRSGERRYCKWCAKYKPDRCHHCRVCRTCILKMDHHCPWIYNCVGFRNHKYFFLLLFYSALDSHLVMWSMLESVTAALRAETPFLTLFWLLLGETISAFLVVLLTVFFSFLTLF